MRNLLIYFAAGCFGALINSLVIWQLGASGVTAYLDVSIAPNLTPDWLYPRIVWGGLWGLFFILPIWQSRLILKGTVLSLFPTLVLLFLVYPLQTSAGVAGLDLGLLTPVLVVFINWVWGVATALMVKLSK